MKVLSVTILAVSLAIGPAAIAKNSKNSTDPGMGQLKQALSAAATAAQGPKPPEHFNSKTDRDQGDDNANPRAILKVCSKDTPAAHRSAICPTGVSPE